MKKTSKKVTTKKAKKSSVSKKATKKVTKKANTNKKGKKPEKKVLSTNKKKPVIDDTDFSSTKKKSKSAAPGDGMYDENGDWNGSTITDNKIEEIADPKEKELVREYDSLQEQLVELREQDDKDLAPDISNVVMEIQRVREKLNQINPNKYI